MRLVFCGTPTFAVPTLRALLSAGHAIELVLTQPDRASGRGMEQRPSAIKQTALQNNLMVEQPEKLRNNPSLQQKLTTLAPDAIVVVAYGRILPPWMLTLPRYGCLNLHASLLPKYRGAAPIQWAIANGETQVGVTTMQMAEGMDTGDILLQEKMAIGPEQTAVEVAPLLAEMGAPLMVETLARLQQGTLTPTPQDDSQATLAPILQREDGHMDHAKTAMDVFNHWRGFQPWPGAYGIFRGKKFSVHRMRPAADGPTHGASPGTLLTENGRLFLACGQGTELELLEVQLEGKKRMAAADFLRGHALASAERLT
jgi:methionyl-tRNA formyltransferase